MCTTADVVSTHKVNVELLQGLVGLSYTLPAMKRMEQNKLKTQQGEENLDPMCLGRLL